MKTYKHLAAVALLLPCCVCFAQSASTAPSTPSSSLSAIGTPDDPDIARSIFPDDQPADLLIAAASDNDTVVRIGVRGHNSTVQVTREGMNVKGAFSVNGIPFVLTARSPIGACNAIGWTLSNDGHGTFCDGHEYARKF